jgi:uncharacterized lipoprotein YddW (UPF0748 family)
MTSWLGALALAAVACTVGDPNPGADGSAADAASTDGLPDGLAEVGHARELRGVWVATVANIDWPDQQGANAADQQAELAAIVDTCADANLNAIMFQVRPEADAFYDSQLEPWSRYLSGSQGVDPGWDPLAFLIEAAHARNIEVHAWINPYRARASEGTPLAPSHIAVTMSEHAHGYRTFTWMDPGAPEVQDHTVAVIADIATRYAVDGVHFDDYFYPYPDGTPFPDDATWNAYLTGGGTSSRDDWRRDNVNTLVERVHDTLANLAPHVRFGISPFGIYRPGQPEGIVGLDQYTALYADPALWKQMGWVDYLAPQLYWATDDAGQEYGKLIEWWSEQDAGDRYTFAGIALYRDFPLAEYAEQLALSRTFAPRNSLGNIHFSMRHIQGDVAAAMRDEWYPTPVLTPPLADHIDATMAPPTVTPDGVVAHDDIVRAYVVYRDDGAGWALDRIVPGDTTAVQFDAGRWAISAVGTHGVESLGAVVERE